MKYRTCFVSFLLAACQEPVSDLTRLSSTVNSLGNASATWSETSEGATTGFVYRLHIHSKNMPAQLTQTTEILRTNNIQDTELQWKPNGDLRINCLRGNVYFWINRSVVDDQNIRIELDTSCPNNAADQWTYIAPGTAVEKIPTVIVSDPRVIEILQTNENRGRATFGLRVLHNSEKTKEVIQVQHH